MNRLGRGTPTLQDKEEVRAVRDFRATFLTLKGEGIL